MHFEVLSAEILNHKSHTFTFTQSVDQFIVGFSKFLIEYPESDHHVQRILIDLTNVHKNDNEIVISPKLLLNDSSNNTESLDTKITVVVLAAIGNNNTNIHMESNLKTKVDHTLSLLNPTFMLSSLTYSYVHFKDGEDHHLNKFSSQIEAIENSDSFNLNGFSKIQDSGKNSATGEVYGSVFIYKGTDQKVMGTNFTSENADKFVMVKLGEKTGEINPKEYKIACFINGFELSYNNFDDHHVKRMEVSCELDEENLIEEEGSLYAKVFLKSYLVDKGKNHFDIPHNSVSGFVVAFNNDSQ